MNTNPVRERFEDEGPSVVVIEPSLPQGLLYRWELEEDGYDVATYTNVSDAIRCSAAQCPDLLLLDCGPDVSELPRTIAGLRAAFPDTAIVLQSASLLCDQAKASALTDVFLHKSSDLGGLRRLVQTLAVPPRNDADAIVGAACLN